MSIHVFFQILQFDFTQFLLRSWCVLFNVHASLFIFHSSCVVYPFCTVNNRTTFECVTLHQMFFLRISCIYISMCMYMRKYTEHTYIDTHTYTPCGLTHVKNTQLMIYFWRFNCKDYKQSHNCSFPSKGVINAFLF